MNLLQVARIENGKLGKFQYQRLVASFASSVTAHVVPFLGCARTKHLFLTAVLKRRSFLCTQVCERKDYRLSCCGFALDILALGHAAGDRSPDRASLVYDHVQHPRPVIISRFFFFLRTTRL